MQRIAAAIALGLALSAVASGQERASARLEVYVTVVEVDPGERADTESATSLKLKRESVRQMRRGLEKRLKQEFGKTRASWPPEKEAELVRLEDAEALAQADYDYRRTDPRAVFDMAREIAESLDGKRVAGKADHLVLAASEAEADLVVNVAASRTGKTFPTQSRPDRCYVLFTIGPGANMSVARFTRVPASYQLKKLGLNAWKIAGPRNDAPVIYFEAYNGGGKEFGCQTGAASAAGAAVDKFVEDNYSVLSAR
jgi:hypothetical protein